MKETSEWELLILGIAPLLIYISWFRSCSLVNVDNRVVPEKAFSEIKKYFSTHWIEAFFTLILFVYIGICFIEEF